jgi:ATP-dependent helicase/DNAse subunit B
LELPKYNPLTEIKKQTLSFDSATVNLPELSYAKTTETMEAIKAIPHFSPSSLSKYINCKLQFYFSYVLRLKVPDEMLEFADDATLGTVIHATLEEIYTPFIDAEIEIKKLSNLNIADLVTAQFAKPKNKISFTSEDLVHGRNRLAFEIATRYVENVLTVDRDSKEKHTLRTLEKELNYTLTWDENSAMLFGKADRIDELEEGSIRIIDYKTGSVDASKLKVKEIETLFYDPKQAKSFQLMMYAYMYHHAISSSEPIRSGIISIRDKKAPFNPLIVYETDVISSEILAEFEAFLRQLLSEIYDAETRFDQTQDTQRCQYCDYKTICNR